MGNVPDRESRQRVDLIRSRRLFELERRRETLLRMRTMDHDKVELDYIRAVTAYDSEFYRRCKEMWDPNSYIAGIEELNDPRHAIYADINLESNPESLMKKAVDP